MDTRTVHTPGLSSTSERYCKFLIPEDLTLPIAVRRMTTEIYQKCKNDAAMQVRIVHGKRVLIRFHVEAYTKHNGTSTYKRLLQEGVTINCGSVEQARLAIDAIFSFAQSLDGKVLARESVTNPQANSSESAADSADSR